MTLPAGLLAARAFVWLLVQAAHRGGEVRCSIDMRIRHQLAIIATSITLAGCPKPQPGPPQPADECKKSGQACADPPAEEGPPPVGSQTPPAS